MSIEFSQQSFICEELDALPIIEMDIGVPTRDGVIQIGADVYRDTSLEKSRLLVAKNLGMYTTVLMLDGSPLQVEFLTPQNNGHSDRPIKLLAKPVDRLAFKPDTMLDGKILWKAMAENLQNPDIDLVKHFAHTVAFHSRRKRAKQAA